jgi:two-component system LytT family response regulator
MARRFRVVIADDEPLARARVESLLRSQSDCEVVARCESGAETVATVRRVRPDILFLDVQMPGGDGFAVLEKLDTDAPPVVVFVTAFDQHALRAFEVHALDYLLKPFDADRFARAVDRARAQLARGTTTGGDARIAELIRSLRDRPQHLERFAIRTTAGKIIFRRAADLDWAEADGNYVRLHFGRESHLQRERLGALETQLDPTRFVRVHRSALINLERVREMRPSFHGDYVVVLETGAEITLGRNYREEVMARLGGRAGGADSAGNSKLETRNSK